MSDMVLFWFAYLAVIIFMVLVYMSGNDQLMWYHRLLYRIPVIKLLGKKQFKRGHYYGATWGMESGYALATGGKKALKQRKITRALERAGISAE